jgi:RimJ/RimL family protein N-acetyltransferase
MVGLTQKARLDGNVMAGMKVSPTDWQPRPLPERNMIKGRYVTLKRFDPACHGDSLWQAFGERHANELLWHFGWPEMTCASDLAQILQHHNDTQSYVTYVFCPSDDDDSALGMASYMNIVPDHGRAETGAIAHGKGLRQSPAATEAHYLMASYIFDELGYRRYEWKLNNTNSASHKAARRLGFTFEGVFRQHEVKRYGNRDTAWYAMLDTEWPRCKAAFQTWLDPDNFDASGGQKALLATLRANQQTG